MIRQIQINNFRNYKEVRLNIQNNSKIVVLYGQNGSGKTNILEAISLFFESTGLRRAKYDEMINNFSENNYWNVSLETEDALFSSSYIKTESSTKKIYKINDKNVKNLNEFKKENYVLWMTYETDRLFMLSPGDRRNFIDMFCNVVSNMHSKNLKDYEKLTRERLKILKKYYEIGFSPDILKWLDIIEQKIATLGVSIALERINLTKVIENHQLTKDNFPKYTNQMQGSLEDLIRKEGSEIIENYKIELKQRRQKDIFSGSTTFGPNRSDWVVFHEEKQIKASYCSAGEQKLLLTDIFLSFIIYSMSLDNRKLILLLDDIIAHLDFSHKNLVFKYIRNFVNNLEKDIIVFLTGVDKALFQELEDCAQFYEIHNGKISYL